MAPVAGVVGMIIQAVAAAGSAYMSYRASRKSGGSIIGPSDSLPTEDDTNAKKAEARRRALSKFGQEKMKLTPALGLDEDAPVAKKKLLGE